MPANDCHNIIYLFLCKQREAAANKGGYINKIKRFILVDKIILSNVNSWY